MGNFIAEKDKVFSLNRAILISATIMPDGLFTDLLTKETDSH
jgi:hypothetical protein